MTVRRATVLLIPALAGCYVYAPSARPIAPGDDVRLFLNDRGRAELTALVGPSLYKTKDWRDRLAEVARQRDVDVDRAFAETDPSDESEGLSAIGKVAA